MDSHNLNQEDDYSRADLENRRMTSTQLRKIKKPIIEKKRRERINESLNQLKNLVLEALQKDENQYNKMEKADILELTVKYLKNLQRQNGTLAKLHCPDRDYAPFGLTDVQWTDNFRDGFRGCADEVLKYLNSAGMTPDVKDRLSSHLRCKMENCRSNTEQVNNNNNNMNQFRTDSCYKLLSSDTNLIAAGAPAGTLTHQAPGALTQAPVVQTLPVLQPVTLLNGQTIYVASNALSAFSPLGTANFTQQPAIPQQILPAPQLSPISTTNATNVCFSPASSVSSTPDIHSSAHLNMEEKPDITYCDGNGNKLTPPLHRSSQNLVPIRPKPVVTETVSTPITSQSVTSGHEIENPLPHNLNSLMNTSSATQQTSVHRVDRRAQVQSNTEAHRHIDVEPARTHSQTRAFSASQYLNNVPQSNSLWKPYQ